MAELDLILVSYWWLGDGCCEGAGRMGVSMREAGEHEERSVGRRRPAKLERARVIRRGGREEVVVGESKLKRKEDGTRFSDPNGNRRPSVPNPS